ncbi:MAG: nucleotide exchange factor GrpE [Elusimicrobiota bacterium]
MTFKDKKKPKEHYQEKIEQLEKELDKQQCLAQDYLDQLKRLKADFDNYRKRTHKEASLNFKSGEKILAKDLLLILDNLQRALENKEIDREGVSLISKEFYNILRTKGLKKMNALGKDFDPNFHHALSFTRSPGEKDNKIVDVVQPGYFWDEEVLRPAQVVVAKAQEQQDKQEKNNNIKGGNER